MSDAAVACRALIAGLARAAALLFVLAALAACSAAGNRPSPSTLGCAQAVLRELPPSPDDKQAHCVAAGLIARRCSPAEAGLTAFAKEFRDLFTSGDAEWADWRADRAGMRCAARSGTDAAVASCCASSIAAKDAVSE